MIAVQKPVSGHEVLQWRKGPSLVDPSGVTVVQCVNFAVDGDTHLPNPLISGDPPEMAREKPWWKQVPAQVQPLETVTPVVPPPAATSIRADVLATPNTTPSIAAHDATLGPNGPPPVPRADLTDGQSTTMQGSGREPYVLKNVGGVYSCSCPAWRNAGGPIDLRTCKHLRKLRGDAAENYRVANRALPPRSSSAASTSTTETTGTTGTTETTREGPPLLLAHAWDNVTDLTEWWMSEKLDGVRAYWDGTRLLSRLGNEFLAPAWFTAGLPPTPLDGELWGGRKNFQRTVSTVRRQDRSEAWRDVRYVVFDLPALREPFETRYQELHRVVGSLGLAHVEAHPHVACSSIAALRAELARVESLGGEGLMLRKPGSFYETGRSHTLLKVKSFFDAEARVVRHLPGTGKHKGRLGALECEMPNGVRFSVGTGLSDDERRNPPPIGSIVTYRCQELSNDGVPRFPSYVGIRDDVSFPGPS